MGTSDSQDLQEKKYTLEEFYSLPEGIRAELIDGIIYHAALPKRIHHEISGEIFSKIHNYIKTSKSDSRVYGVSFRVQLSEDTLVEPDITVVCDRSKLAENGCNGVPDFIIEITSSYTFNEYVKKYDLYKMYGVHEYWIINTNEKLVTVCNFDNTVSEKNEYNFTDNIPVGIYKDNPELLEICLKDFLADY